MAKVGPGGNGRTGAVWTGEKEGNTGDVMTVGGRSPSAGVMNAALLQAASDRVGYIRCDSTSDWTRYYGKYIYGGGDLLNRVWG